MINEFKNKKVYSNNNLVAYLRSNIDPDSSLLDLGCGPKIYCQAVADLCSSQITVDAWSEVEPDIIADLETFDIKTAVKNVDYIFMLDFIEHLDKAAGQRLLDDCKKIVNKKIFLLTPLAEIWTENKENVELYPELWCHGNKYDYHKSLWDHNDFVGFVPAYLYTLENYFLGFWTRN